MTILLISISKKNAASTALHQYASIAKHTITLSHRFVLTIPHYTTPPLQLSSSSPSSSPSSCSSRWDRPSRRCGSPLPTSPSRSTCATFASRRRTTSRSTTSRCPSSSSSPSSAGKTHHLPPASRLPPFATPSQDRGPRFNPATPNQPHQIPDRPLYQPPPSLAHTHAPLLYDPGATRRL